MDCFVASLLAMTKTMDTRRSPHALVLLDYFGIAVFAVSGALLAAEKKQTLVTFIFFAVVTGVGGGTLRDLLIGAPVFWVHTNATLLICIVAALGVWLPVEQADRRPRPALVRRRRPRRLRHLWRGQGARATASLRSRPSPWA